MSRHHLTMPLAPLTKPASTQATYMDNAAPTPLNTSPRPTSRVEERTAPSVDDGCYTWRDVKIVGILPVKEVEEPKDRNLRLVLHTYISHVLKIDLLSNSTLMKKSLSSSSSLNFEVTRIMHILCIIYGFCMHIFAPIMQKSAQFFEANLCIRFIWFILNYLAYLFYYV